MTCSLCVKEVFTFLTVLSHTLHIRVMYPGRKCKVGNKYNNSSGCE